MTRDMTRRLFLLGSGSMAGSSIMRAGLPTLAAALQAACSAQEAEAGFENLGQIEAREFAAIAARIFPATDTPGATEAGVVYFIDQAFSRLLEDSGTALREKLAEFEAGIASRYTGTERFSDLDAADQDAYLVSQEDTPFFLEMRFLTLAGVFGLSTWGGNRDDIGWKHVGMDGPPHPWAPPFGHYDTEHAKVQPDGE